MRFHVNIDHIATLRNADQAGDVHARRRLTFRHRPALFAGFRAAPILETVRLVRGALDAQAPTVTLIGFAAIISGAVTLVWRLRSGDDDDDFDDGAVV